MKKHNFLVANILILVALLISCKHSLVEKPSVKNDKSGKTEIYFSIESGYARTALPDFDFNVFKYELTAVKDGIVLEEPLVKNSSFSAYEGSLGIEPGKYVFILTGYDDDTNKTIQGVSKEYDLTKGTALIQFIMYPISGAGLEGNIEITINLPNDNVIKGAKAYITSSLSTAAGETESISAVNNKIIFAKSGVAAGKKQYAVINLYDENGACICSINESLIVVTGQTSRATRTITPNMYHRYQVNIKFITEYSDGRIDDIFNTQTITVRGEDGKNYTLIQQADGSYSGMLAEQNYTVIAGGKDTGISFSSPNATPVIKFKQIVMPSGGIVLDNIRNGIVSQDGTIVFIPEADESFTADVFVKDGYEVGADSTVQVNNQPVRVTDDGTGTLTGTVTLPGSITEITTSGITPIEYTINYVLGSGSWKAGYTAPLKYTVENKPALPVYSDVNAPEGKILDGWSFAGTMCAYIPEGITGNVTMTAIYKDGVQIQDKTEIPEEFDGAEGVIYAKGYNLLIKWRNNDPSTNYTEVYYDYNGDGIVNESDKLIQQNTNFNNYVLKASDIVEENAVASDFTFNMTGGRIYALVGLGKDKPNKSTVNISGQSIIGDFKTIGIDLASLTNEKVNIVGEMTGAYQITLLSENTYDPNHYGNRVIADIADKNYAQLKNFKCLPKGAAANSSYVSKGENGEPDYLLLSVTDDANSTGSVVYLMNPRPIGLPADGKENNGIIWEEYNGIVSDTEFSFGNSATIIKDCSVFSLSVKNGRFKIRPSADGKDTTVMTDKNGNTYATENLCQYKVVENGKEVIKYRADDNKVGREVLAANEEYVYLHMLSAENQITANAAERFLRNIIFIKDNPDVDIDVTVNLETVKYSDIVEFVNKGQTVSVPKVNMDKNSTNTNNTAEIYENWNENITLKGKKFSYYDGSFYLGVEGAYDWITAYNIAKKAKFNGLNGYLINISSDVENNYIEACMKLDRSWIGGSRIVPKEGSYDKEVFEIDPEVKNYTFEGRRYITVVEKWITKKKLVEFTETVKGNGLFYSPDFRWQSGPEAGQIFTKGEFHYEDVQRDGYVATYAHRITERFPDGVYSNWEQLALGDSDTDEPNNYGNDPENCAQFHANGRWNDLKYNTTQDDYRPKGYIIEFSPYVNANWRNEATEKNISQTGHY